MKSYLLWALIPTGLIALLLLCIPAQLHLIRTAILVIALIAAVVGVADKLRGELPKAFLVVKEGKSIPEEDLRYFLRQHLAHFKIPHYFEFCVELPKNRTGKIDKERLRNNP